MLYFEEIFSYQSKTELERSHLIFCPESPFLKIDIEIMTLESSFTLGVSLFLACILLCVWTNL